MSASLTLPRTRKRRGEGPARRGEILAAATRIFLEEGVAQATMRRIAASVGLSTTGLYVYFPDKAAIMQAIAERAFADLLASLEASQRGVVDAEARLHAGLHAYIASARAAPDAYRLIFAAAAREAPPVCETIADADHSFAILERTVDELIAAGRFRGKSPLVVAEALWACVHGTAMLLLDKAAQIDTDPDELAGTVIGMAIAGCRHLN